MMGKIKQKESKNGPGDHADSCECHTDHERKLKYIKCPKPRCKNDGCEFDPDLDDFGFQSIGAGYYRRIYRCGICGHRFLSSKSV